MNILITGGTGFIGKHLICHILKTRPQIEKIFILSRNPKKAYKIFAKYEDRIHCIDKLEEISAVEKFTAIIHLAGAGIADKRWSNKRKEVLRSSRIDIAEKIVELHRKLRNKPEIVISASAVGFYGAHGDEVLDESSNPNEEFTHFLCRDLENKISEISDPRTRICLTRFGVVLGRNGGALKKMLPAFRFGLGGKIASGKQIMSWIHIHDLVIALLFLLDSKELSGAFNFTAPNPVSNEKFAQELASALNRPTLFDMPLGLLKFLFGEMGVTLLANGQNVQPKRLLETGFVFKYKNLRPALEALLKKK